MLLDGSPSGGYQSPNLLQRGDPLYCVSLLHTNRAGEFFLYGGLRLIAGKDHEGPVLYELVDEFVQYHGRGVMKRLLLDRGFLDGRLRSNL